jgi:hypothetical protein
LDIAELRQKQTDAINVLKRFGTIDALQWLMECDASQNPNFKIEMSGQRSGMKIKRHLSFQSGNSTYDLYMLNERSFSIPDDIVTKGDFQLYVDSSLVLETDYDVNSDEWCSNRKLSWSISSEHSFNDGTTFTVPGAVKTIKLSDWVETLPEIVENQKQEIENRSKKNQEEKNKKEASETAGNFDLGKYK